MFEIKMQSGVPQRFDRVLLASGGDAWGHEMARALGHNIVPCVPSLFTFRVKDPRLEGLSGVSFDNAKLTLIIGNEKRLNQVGAVLITHRGLSGPAILKLSSWGARMLYESSYQAELIMNLLPDYTTEQLYLKLLDYKKQNGRKHVLGANPLPVAKRYWSRIAEITGTDEEIVWTDLTKDIMKSIIGEITHGRFAINGKDTFQEEFVTCGGVDLREVDFRTMESRICPGLYFAGEILDIDGVTGGFNLQNAWTTGWIAGSNMGL